MTAGVMLPRDLAAAEIVPFARRAEELGFGEVWIVEDLGFHGGIEQAATVLAVTSRIRVGIGILPAGARNVAFAAMELATLARLRPALFAEYARTLTGLLRGERVRVDGRYVRLDGAGLETVPAAREDLRRGRDRPPEGR